MAPLPEADRIYAVECPHCHERFESEPMPGRAARYAGFKCPHCRLFVPFDRASSEALDASRVPPVEARSASTGR